MAVLTEDELIKIRRHLHEIPELALQEKETYAYLLEVIQNFKQDYLTIKTPESLPTALLVLVKARILNEQLVIEQISMLCQLLKKQVCHFLQKLLA